MSSSIGLDLTRPLGASKQPLADAPDTKAAGTVGTAQPPRVLPQQTSTNSLQPLRPSGWLDPSSYMTCDQLHASRQGDTLLVRWPRLNVKDGEAHYNSFKAEVEGVTPRGDGGFDLHVQAQLPEQVPDLKGDGATKLVRSRLRLTIHSDTLESEGPHVSLINKGPKFRLPKALAPQDDLHRLVSGQGIRDIEKLIKSYVTLVPVAQLKKEGYVKADWEHGREMMLELSAEFDPEGGALPCVSLGKENWRSRFTGVKSTRVVTVRLPFDTSGLGIGNFRTWPAPDGRGLVAMLPTAVVEACWYKKDSDLGLKLSPQEFSTLQPGARLTTEVRCVGEQYWGIMYASARMPVVVLRTPKPGDDRIDVCAPWRPSDLLRSGLAQHATERVTQAVCDDGIMGAREELYVGCPYTEPGSTQVQWYRFPLSLSAYTTLQRDPYAELTAPGVQQDGKKPVYAKEVAPQVPDWQARWSQLEDTPYEFLPSEGTQTHGKLNKSDLARIQPGQVVVAGMFDQTHGRSDVTRAVVLHREQRGAHMDLYFELRGGHPDGGRKRWTLSPDSVMPRMTWLNPSDGSSSSSSSSASSSSVSGSTTSGSVDDHAVQPPQPLSVDQLLELKAGSRIMVYGVPSLLVSSRRESSATGRIVVQTQQPSTRLDGAATEIPPGQNLYELGVGPQEMSDMAPTLTRTVPD